MGGILQCASDCSALDETHCGDIVVGCSEPGVPATYTYPNPVDAIDIDIPSGWYISDVDVLVEATTGYADLYIATSEATSGTRLS